MQTVQSLPALDDQQGSPSPVDRRVNANPTLSIDSGDSSTLADLTLPAVDDQVLLDKAAIAYLVDENHSSDAEHDNLHEIVDLLDQAVIIVSRTEAVPLS